MKVTTLPRVFEFQGRQLADPNPDLNLDQVKEVLAVAHPSITNAEIKGPEVTSTAQVYKVQTNYGTKG